MRLCLYLQKSIKTQRRQKTLSAFAPTLREAASRLCAIAILNYAPSRNLSKTVRSSRVEVSPDTS
jgi:hypothetical protein